MSEMVYYIPIICCGFPMTEIYKGDKRIGAMCQVCKKAWYPKEPESNTWKITTIQVKR